MAEWGSVFVELIGLLLYIILLVLVFFFVFLLFFSVPFRCFLKVVLKGFQWSGFRYKLPIYQIIWQWVNKKVSKKPYW